MATKVRPTAMPGYGPKDDPYSPKWLAERSDDGELAGLARGSKPGTEARRLGDAWFSGTHKKNPGWRAAIEKAVYGTTGTAEKRSSMLTEREAFLIDTALEAHGRMMEKQAGTANALIQLLGGAVGAGRAAGGGAAGKAALKGFIPFRHTPGFTHLAPSHRAYRRVKNLSRAGDVKGTKANVDALARYGKDKETLGGPEARRRLKEVAKKHPSPPGQIALSGLADVFTPGRMGHDRELSSALVDLSSRGHGGRARGGLQRFVEKAERKAAKKARK